MPRAKYPHCSARARDGLISLPPLHSLTHLLHRFRRSLPLIPKSANLTRPSRKTAGAPKLQRAKTSSLALLARLEPSLRFRFSLIALGRGDKNKMAARLRPARRDYGARRCLSPKTKALASRGFARCKTSAIVAATVQLSVASLLAGAARTYAPETGRPRWKNQISLRPRRWTSRPAVSSSPVLPWNWPSFRSVPAPGTQRNWHCAIATVPGNEVTRRNVEAAPLTGLA